MIPAVRSPHVIANLVWLRQSNFGSTSGRKVCNTDLAIRNSALQAVHTTSRRERQAVRPKIIAERMSADKPCRVASGFQARVISYRVMAENLAQAKPAVRPTAPILSLQSNAPVQQSMHALWGPGSPPFGKGLPATLLQSEPLRLDQKSPGAHALSKSPYMFWTPRAQVATNMRSSRSQGEYVSAPHRPTPSAGGQGGQLSAKPFLLPPRQGRGHDLAQEHVAQQWASGRTLFATLIR